MYHGDSFSCFQNFGDQYSIQRRCLTRTWVTWQTSDNVRSNPMTLIHVTKRCLGRISPTRMLLKQGVEDKRFHIRHRCAQCCQGEQLRRVGSAPPWGKLQYSTVRTCEDLMTRKIPAFPWRFRNNQNDRWKVWKKTRVPLNDLQNIAFRCPRPQWRHRDSNRGRV